jgi:hypothetical protein
VARPTKAMADNAQLGLELRERFNRGGTEVGVRRARQLANLDDLSDADIKAMHSYFARHAIDKEAKAKAWGSKTDPSAGYIAWLLWGGDAGAEWAKRERGEINEQ